MKKIKSIRINGTLSAVLTILLGIWFVVNPYSSGSMIARIVGIAIFCSGALDTVRNYKTEIDTYSSKGSMITGILKMLLGAYIAINTDRLLSFFSYIFSVIILFSAFGSFQKSRWMKKLQVPGWQVSMTFSTALLIAGAVMFLMPFGAVSTAIMIVGVVLVVAGITELMTARKMKQIGEQYFRMKFGYNEKDIIDD